MADSAERYNSVLEIINERLIPDATAKKARGEVFTPLNLVREMLFGIRKSAIDKDTTEIWGIDKEGNFFDDNEDDRLGGIPLAIWRNPQTKWLDPANGIGNFPVVAFYMLDYQLGKHGPKELRGNEHKLKRRNHIVEKMLYMIELDKGNVETSKSLFKKIYQSTKPNILCADTLKLENAKLIKHFSTSKFDIIMGNPPFNPPKTETGSSGNSIWQNFVMKSYSMLNDKGYLLFVHPPGWKKPTDEVFKPEKFSSGDYTGQIRQGQVWQVLKDSGVFKFIYTNDQKSKAVGEDFLPHFPAVDYYLYQKSGDKSICDTKNVSLGTIELSKGVRLNYNLKYLPNLITKETQEILHKITSKEGDKTIFKAGFDPRGFNSKEKGSIKYIYDASVKGPNYAFYSEKAPNVDISKIVLNENGGINGYYCKYIDKSEHIGVLHHTLLFPIEKETGKNIEKFFNSDLVKFIFLITQYTSGKMTTNERLVANSLTIPPEGTDNYYKFFDIEEHKKYIEDILSHYENFKAPKREAKTEKKKKGGSRKPHRVTRKIRRS